MDIKKIIEGKPSIKRKNTYINILTMYLLKYKKIIIYILIISLLLFPKTYGTFIGNWINDFFGTIYEKNINYEKDSRKYIQNN